MGSRRSEEEESRFGGKGTSGGSDSISRSSASVARASAIPLPPPPAVEAAVPGPDASERALAAPWRVWLLCLSFDASWADGLAGKRLVGRQGGGKACA